VIGSSSTGAPAMETGTWAAIDTITLIVESGAFIVGQGGAGGAGTPETAGANAGDALSLAEDIILDNAGVIGGGGGGGGGDLDGSASAGGGGGAGDNVGNGGSGGSNGDPGTLENGGNRGIDFVDTFEAFGGNGGNLGINGQAAGAGAAGGNAGKAIDLNGNTITESGSGEGDTRGVVS